MTEGIPAGESEKRSQLGLARASLVFGLISIPLFFVIVPGLIALVSGYLARKKLSQWPDTRKGSMYALLGTTLGVCSLCLIGTWIIGSLFPRNSRHGMSGATWMTATALEQAVNSIYTEYGRIPNVGTSVTTTSPGGLTLLNILLGLDASADKALNSRAIKFLSVKEGKNHRNGVIYNTGGTSAAGLYDPWGNPYTVILDTDYNEALQFTLGSKTIDLKGRRCSVFSPGPDKQIGTGDDVKTW